MSEMTSGLSIHNGTDLDFAVHKNSENWMKNWKSGIKPIPKHTSLDMTVEFNTPWFDQATSDSVYQCGPSLELELRGIQARGRVNHLFARFKWTDGNGPMTAPFHLIRLTHHPGKWTDWELINDRLHDIGWKEVDDRVHVYILDVTWLCAQVPDMRLKPGTIAQDIVNKTDSTMVKDFWEAKERQQLTIW